MYDFLEGEIAARSAARVVIAAGGVGYEVAVPIGPGEALPLGARVRLHVHLHVSDGEPRLFGFSTREERDLFRLLIGVNGVGPATGLSILSALRPPDLARAIAEADSGALRRVRGVGEKTAQRLLLELKGRIEPPASTGRIETDAVAALLSLGYPRKEAEDAVARAARGRPARDLETLVRAALSGSAPAGPRARVASDAPATS
jgi:Holliday junction DNA helicase RuvA